MRIFSQLFRHRVILAATVLLGFALGAGTTTAGSTARHGDPMLRGIDLERTTIPQLQDAMDHGRISSLLLTAFYLERIEDLNPELHAVIATDPTALIQAAFSDIRRATHHLIGPMDGIPVLLKDNVDTEVLRATAGSEALLGARGR